MKKFKLSALLIYAVILGFSACGGGGGGGSDDPQNPGDDKTISISVINGVTPPAFGETPVSVITANAQFSGTVSWNTSTAKFAANTVYTATIELTAKDGYTIEGVSDNFFEVSGASVVTNDADSGIITAEFPATGSAPPAVVTIKAISGVIAPVRDAVPVTEITETEQYTGTISWSGSPAKFAASTVYTATITLTAKSGYTFNGISANYFTVSGATSVLNSSNSGVIKAVFQKTEDLILLIDNTTITFPTGTSFNSVITPEIPKNYKFSIYYVYSELVNVPNQFIMSETEVTYELWYEVYKWATTDVGGGKRADGGGLYSFAHEGSEGCYGIDGAAPTAAKHEPVTCINWRDSMIWCNALTEYYNANNGEEIDLAVVYCVDPDYTTPIRDSIDGIYYSEVNLAEGSYDNPYVNIGAKGFRLPTGIEWEFAARYIGTSKPIYDNYVYRDNIYYTPGSYASGAISNMDKSAVSDVAVYRVSNDVDIRTAAVKSKRANGLGLYDMSGNVSEWTFDWASDEINKQRQLRGGNFSVYMGRLWVGLEDSEPPYEYGNRAGFRFCRSR